MFFFLIFLYQDRLQTLWASLWLKWYFSALLALCAGNSTVTGEFPSQRPVTRSFYIFFDLRLDKRMSKQSRRRWFETPSRSLWHLCNGDLNLRLKSDLEKCPISNLDILFKEKYAMWDHGCHHHSQNHWGEPNDRWLQLQLSSAWPPPTVSAFQYFRSCALTKSAVSHFLRRIYSLSKEEAL